MISRDEFIQMVKEQTGWSRETVEESILSSSPSQRYLASLKVDQLKRILKQLTLSNYDLPNANYYNKPHLLQFLQDFLNSYSPADRFFHFKSLSSSSLASSSSAPPPPPLPTPPPPQRQSGSASSHHSVVNRSQPFSAGLAAVAPSLSSSTPQQRQPPPPVPQTFQPYLAIPYPQQQNQNSIPSTNGARYQPAPLPAQQQQPQQQHQHSVNGYSQHQHHHHHKKNHHGSSHSQKQSLPPPLTTPPPPPPPPPSFQQNPGYGAMAAPSSSAGKRTVAQLSKHERMMYSELAEIEGLTEEEILEALHDCPAAQKNVNTILMMIIDRKQNQHGPPMIAPSTKEQEDAELDRAILESEKERDNIQERKRKRISSILEDTELKIIHAAEFKKSVLLHGLPSQYHPTSSSSANISPSASLHQASSSNSSLTGLHADIIRHGSFVIRSLCEMIDDHYDVKDIEVIDLSFTEDPLTVLRQSLVRLLLIEHDALKYYGEVCYPYLIFLAESFDKQYPLAILNNGLRCGSSGSSPNHRNNRRGSWYHRLPPAQHEQIEATIKKCKEDFEQGLFKIVKDGEGVPTIFRKNYLKPYYQMVSHRLDSEGFELIAEEKEAVKFVEDISSEESEDDDDEDDFDDD